MSMVEALFYIIGFAVCYGIMCFIGLVVDKLLRRVFGRGILPEGYWR